MRKKKGIALPTAIALCSFMLLVSMSVGTALLIANSNNTYSRRKTQYELIYLKTHNQFVNKNPTTTDTSFITDTNFNWKVYIENENLKAVAAYRANNLQFYSVYDFENGKVLAYQSSSFYITHVDGYDYLGGLVKVSD